VTLLAFVFSTEPTGCIAAVIATFVGGLLEQSRHLQPTPPVQTVGFVAEGDVIYLTELLSFERRAFRFGAQGGALDGLGLSA